ncbi:MAG: hypothetical protein HY785_04980 [Oscillatoriophycideae cyanobacterium NC_groundwater_1537_Pr4_S-0.65um_50_18]|nr:hypothetical protein [Oscillatoriophycideae cyanobacterium NC_groundwater_1537_Pr4_S-0.65um_50_18]
MTLSQTKPAQMSTQPNRSPQPSLDNELYVASFTPIPSNSALPQTPLLESYRVRKVTFAVLLTLAFLALVTALLISHIVTIYEAVEQQKLRSSTLAQQQIHQTQQILVSQVESLKSSTAYEGCIEEAKSLLASRPQGAIYARTTTALRECQAHLSLRWMNQAQEAADRGELRGAIALAHQIEGDKQPEAQQKIKGWTEQIMQMAEESYKTGRLNSALEMAGAIRRSNPLYAFSQSKIESWNREWTANTSNWQAASLAVNADQLETARLYVQQITDHPYWQSLAQETKTNIEQRQTRYEQIYQEAQSKLALNQYNQAIALGTQLPNTIPWVTLKQSLTKRAESACRGVAMQAVFLTWSAGVVSGWLLYSQGRRA